MNQSQKFLCVVAVVGFVAGLLLGIAVGPVGGQRDAQVPLMHVTDLPEQFVAWSEQQAAGVGFGYLPLEDQPVAQGLVAAMLRAREIPTYDDLTLILIGMGHENELVARWAVVAAGEVLEQSPRQLSPQARHAIQVALTDLLDSPSERLRIAAKNRLAALR